MHQNGWQQDNHLSYLSHLLRGVQPVGLAGCFPMLYIPMRCSSARRFGRMKLFQLQAVQLSLTRELEVNVSIGSPKAVKKATDETDLGFDLAAFDDQDRWTAEKTI